MTKAIAGHLFTGFNGRCSCGKLFSDISGTPRSAIGQHGWAHEGIGIEREWFEVQEEDRRIWDLVVGAATGNGPASAETEADYSGAEAA